MGLETAIIGVAMSGLTVAQQAAQNQAAKDWRTRVFRETSIAAKQDMFRGLSSLARRQREEHEAVTYEIQSMTNQSRRALGSAAVAAGASGLGGQSLTSLLDSFEEDRLAREGVLLKNESFMDLQFLDAAAEIRATAKNRIRSAAGGPITPPDYIGGALKGFESGAKIGGAVGMLGNSIEDSSPRKIF